LQQGQHAITIALRIGPGFQRRRRRTEQHRNTELVRPENGNVARRVAHAVLLLEGRIVLLINDDQPEAWHGGEDGQPGAEHDSGLAGKGSAPITLTRRFGQFAMQRDDTGIRETGTNTAFELRCQVDFRHQQQDLFADGQRLVDQAQIDLGLAAAGDAVQQVAGETGCGVDGVHRPRLLIGQLRRRGRRRIFDRSPGASIRWIKPLEATRQRLHDHFTQCRLVVSAGKPAEPEKIGRKRRQIAQDFASRLELVERPVTVVADLDNDAQFFAAAEGHPDPQADIHLAGRGAQIVEQAMQRQIEGNAQNGHGFSGRSRHFSEKTGLFDPRSAAF